MDLKTFIKETLCQISEGMIEAQEELKDKGVRINPPYNIDDQGNFENAETTTSKEIGGHYQSIEFDVALTAIDSSKTGGRFSIAVAVANLTGGKVKEEASSSFSRIRFRIAALLPQYKSVDK